MTNYEKIKSMSAKEMAIFINDTAPCQVCAFENESCVFENVWGVCKRCYKGVKQWLESEAEDD